MKETKKRKKASSIFKEIKNDTQKKAIVKLIAMGVFFLILIVCLKMTDYQPPINQNTKKQLLPFSFDLIESNNYHFEYIEGMNANLVTYQGDRNGEKELFSNGVDQFYKENDIYLKKENNEWKECKLPYTFSQFMEISKVKEILERSTMISKTEYKEGNRVFTYQVSTSTLQEVINQSSIDIEDIPNEVIIKTNQTNQVIEISFKLDSYAIYNQLGMMASTNIKYSRFGEIKEIENNA